MTTQHLNYLQGKTGRIYAARKGTILVFLLNNGESWFCNTQGPGVTITAGPINRNYWAGAIDFAGGFSDYFTFGMAYDETDSQGYPKAEPIIPINPERLEKLRKMANSFSAASALGSIKSDKKAASSAANGAKGGRPKKKTE